MSREIRELMADFLCLRSLLSDPHPDLEAWREALERRLLQIQGKINELQEESLIRQKERALGIIIHFLAGAIQNEALEKEKTDEIWEIIKAAKAVKQAASEDDITSAMKNLHKAV